MTAADSSQRGSVRPSGRVELKRVPDPKTRDARPISAPESMASAASRAGFSSPEGGVVHADRLPLLGQQLSVRQWGILDSLNVHAFLTADHLRRLHFTDHATESAASRICRRVLQRMAEQRLIEHLDRRIGGIRAGSNSFVWRIGLIGDRLLRARDGDGIRARRKEPSAYYLDHRLAVAEVDVQLREADRAGQLELFSVETEPTNWRLYLGGQGSREILKPDLYAVTASAEFEDSWFIEVDRGTESIPTLIRKCAQYEAYRRTGGEQRDRGIFPYVVWQLPNQARVAKLTAAIRAARTLDERLYRLTTPDRLLPLIIAGGAS